jgi:hypothetical protein
VIARVLTPKRCAKQRRRPGNSRVGFHLGLNLREAVERVLSKQSADLRKAVQEVNPRYQSEQMLRAEGLLKELPAPAKRPVTKPQALKAERRERRLARYEEVHRLFQVGFS